MLYSLLAILYLGVVALIIRICHAYGLGWFGKVILVLFLINVPFWDGYISKAIMWNYARHNQPLQQIIRTVEKPESVLWIDNVWPGYNKIGRKWMVTNYLDGVHVNRLAMNGDDNRIYLYRASIEAFTESEKLRPEHERLKKKIKELEQEANEIWRSRTKGAKWPWPELRKKYEQDTAELQLEIKRSTSQLRKLGYEAQRKKEIKQIISRVEIYSKLVDLPAMNYRVEFNRNRLPQWQEKYVWCDELRIRDDRSHEVIAFSKRCLGYSLKTTRIMVGNWPFEGGSHTGDYWVYEFDNKVLFDFSLLADEGHDSTLSKR